MAQVGIKRARSVRSFEPSMKTLLRIMKIITKNGSESKTQLSLDTNLNYSRLARHIVWLEKKGLVESKIEDSKINVALTEKGIIFASVFSETYSSTAKV
jgi:predicted transcriptional regulator